MTTASDVTGKLAGLIDGALGASESPATKARIHAVGTIVGAIGNELVPLLDSRFDTAGLLAGIERIENGAGQIEGGITDIEAALKRKPVQDQHQAKAA